MNIKKREITYVKNTRILWSRRLLLAFDRLFVFFVDLLVYEDSSGTKTVSHTDSPGSSFEITSFFEKHTRKELATSTTILELTRKSFHSTDGTTLQTPSDHSERSDIALTYQPAESGKFNVIISIKNV